MPRGKCEIISIKFKEKYGNWPMLCLPFSYLWYLKEMPLSLDSGFSIRWKVLCSFGLLCVCIQVWKREGRVRKMSAPLKSTQTFPFWSLSQLVFCWFCCLLIYYQYFCCYFMFISFTIRLLHFLIIWIVMKVERK